MGDNGKDDASRATPDKEVRRGGIRTLGTVLPQAASGVLRKRGFAHGKVITHWAEIVGPELAAQSMPEKLVFPRDGQAGGATLHVRASGAMALELQHLAPIVLERVNGFFGYAAVEKLTLQQAPVVKAKPKPKRVPRALEANEREALDAVVANTADAELREALRGLGQRVAESQPAPRKPSSR